MKVGGQADLSFKGTAKHLLNFALVPRSLIVSHIVTCRLTSLHKGKGSDTRSKPHPQHSKLVTPQRSVLAAAELHPQCLDHCIFPWAACHQDFVFSHAHQHWYLSNFLTSMSSSYEALPKNYGKCLPWTTKNSAWILQKCCDKISLFVLHFP